MAYQPPTRSPYGDTELTDDGWSRTSTTSQADYPTGGTLAPPHTPSGYRGINQNIQPGSKLLHEQLADFNAVAASMTQDDILFMRNLRQECFFYRVLPFSLASSGALFMFNRYKQVPHKPVRYFGVFLISSFVAVSSYRNQFRQRVAESRLKTPYMQTMRKVMNLPAVMDDFAGDYGMEYGRNSADGGVSNWESTDLSSDPRFNGRTAGLGLSESSSLDQSSYQPLDQQQENNGFNQTKQETTYEELRARNRGYIK